MKPVFVDIGAHLGFETKWALEHGYEVYAFEPNPMCVLTLNNYQASAYICYAAAWREDGFATFYAGADTGNQGASLYKEKTTIQPRLRTKVQTINIGRFLKRLGRDIAILKINAEGAEWDIVDSIACYFDFSRIGQLWIEDHIGKIISPRWEALRDDMREYLSSHNVEVVDWTPELLEMQK